MMRGVQLIVVAMLAWGCADDHAAGPRCADAVCATPDATGMDGTVFDAKQDSSRHELLPNQDAAGSSLDVDLAEPEVTDDVGTDLDTQIMPICSSDDACMGLMGAESLEPCERWRCADGTCVMADMDEGELCALGSENGRCSGGVCASSCGDGLVQESTGEQCDDGNTDGGDGCRDDCVIEEMIGAGWIGGQCQFDSDCAPDGSFCMSGVGGGSCALPCTATCPDQDDAPVTFCIDTTRYDPGAELLLPSELSPALCVSKCDFQRFPRTGCRAGLHCELHTRHNQTVLDEVCVPGEQPFGLAFEDDEQVVTGALQGVVLAQPYAKLLTLGCGSEGFTPTSWRVLRALADTLLAMGPDGRIINWERLCATDVSIPNTDYDLHVQVAAGQAFRLLGDRTDIIDWAAAGHYGTAAARGVLVGGPLWPVRTMVYRQDVSYLYVDAASDLPYPWYPERGRDFAMVDAEEWEPMDAWLIPGEDFLTAKANKGDRFRRQWGRADVIAYMADMALAYSFAHGELLGIGDLSYATGGDIDDHASHELGRDVDLYIVTSEPTLNGIPLGPRPWLWVSQCGASGCFYVDNDTGEAEDLRDPNHIPAALLLETLAQYAFDVPGPTHFVHHDVDVLAPFGSLSGLPVYIHADNAAASGWPPHQNHVHLRFPL